MDAFLGKITQHAVNYAIRSGISLTTAFALNQTSRLLRTVEDDGSRKELGKLQERLDGKIRIISPAIDMIELISARGNTTLESAVTLTKALRWDIQSLGTRLEKAAAAEELARKHSTRSKSQAAHETEIRLIILDIRALLARIEDAVPLINLAIATSGASLSTTLPNTVSPSRMMQASTLLTYGDWEYCTNPLLPVQIGPTMTLSLYMLFAGHTNVEDGNDGDSPKKTKQKDPRRRPEERELTWKEVIHKAQIRLMRVPLHPADPNMKFMNGDGRRPSVVSDVERASEYAYSLKIIEDLEDSRVHDFEEDDIQPGPYEGVRLAGIRETLPIHQISKIFYADTGKILNIGSAGESNSPVLLLKRDMNAPPPNRMMEDDGARELWERDGAEEVVHESSGDSQDDIDQQIRRESSIFPQHQTDSYQMPEDEDDAWRFPPDLDQEWFALEVYTEPEGSDSDSEPEQEPIDAEITTPARQTSEPHSSSEEKLRIKLTHLNLSNNSPISVGSPVPTPYNKLIPTPKPGQTFSPSPSPFYGDVTSSQPLPIPNTQNQAPSTPFGVIRSSLSLLEMLIRLTALQQFQQASHLTIPDQLLNFFLSESSTTGGTDADGRRRTRYEARRKVGFDPYDESPMKMRGEDYQYQQHDQYASPSRRYEDSQDYRENSANVERDDQSLRYPSENPRWSPQNMEPRRHRESQEMWLRNRDITSSGPRFETSDTMPESPDSPYRPVRKAARPLQRARHETSRAKGSPLGRGISVETDSTLGTSPGSPT
ncbi:RanGTP-binding protein-domain-containing protein [Amylocarpus encephaloides]|uniref:RanGTP-binding protein-domain-containing protein n=1 Tax=Amylocarpus encephaloides TaxID=45428 RepID=A0A9P8C9E8_9HELO|nr:RanGTP-binding protein-domain-containing protein [Amylocarpus encephaloides]